MGRLLLLATTSLAGYAYWRSRQNARPAAAVPLPAAVPDRLPFSEDAANVAEVTRNFLMGFVLPLWLAAGVADWICHRAADIETTTGTKESLMHLLMLTEAAVPVMAGLFLEITSPVVALMIASFLLHDMTALWDVSYAVTLREVTPVEQHVHSFLEMVPLMAVAFVCVLHWPQVLALFGFGERKPDWSVRLKKRPLPWRYVSTMLGAMATLEWAPYLEELARTLAARNRRDSSLRAQDRLPGSVG
jgi:hypothetical protein